MEVRRYSILRIFLEEVHCSVKSFEFKSKRKYSKLKITQRSAGKKDSTGGNHVEIHRRGMNTREKRKFLEESSKLQYYVGKSSQ